MKQNKKIWDGHKRYLKKEKMYWTVTRGKMKCKGQSQFFIYFFNSWNSHKRSVFGFCRTKGMKTILYGTVTEG